MTQETVSGSGTSLQTDNHASTSPLDFFTGQMPFLPPNQQCQSTEGKNNWWNFRNILDILEKPNLQAAQQKTAIWKATRYHDTTASTFPLFFAKCT